MRIRKVISWLPVSVILAALALLPACSVNVKITGTMATAKSISALPLAESTLTRTRMPVTPVSPSTPVPE
jgi:hypothetical protein